MALRKIALQPGFNKQDTPTQAEGRWIDGDNVRFRYGSPEKIGGWAQTVNKRLVGATRAQHTWADLDGNRYSALGTNKILALYYGGAFYDITPFANTVATCTITTTTSSSTVTIDKSSHGLDTGDLLKFANVTLTGDTNFTASNFTTDVFEVQADSSNSFNVVMATVETGSGMSAAGNVDTKPYVVVGPITQTVGYGFGTSTWNASTWGTARAASGVTIDPGNWSLDNFGEKLVATVHNNKTYQWDPSAANPLDTRATVIATNPTASVMTIVSDRDRHLIHLGTETTIGSVGTQDKMYIRFSDQEDFTDYVPTSTNTAGTMQLDQGTQIIGAIQGKDYTLILTDKAAYIMQYVGPPFTFSIRQIGSGCGSMGPHAAAFANGKVFWMSNSGGFFMFDGTVKSLPCLVEDFVFTTAGNNLGINEDSGGNLVFAGHNSLFTEVSWFYPKSGSSQVDRIVTYNYDDNLWTTGTLARTTWADSNIYSLPFATELSTTALSNFPIINGVTAGATTMYEQETGVNAITKFSTGNVTTAVSSSLSSGDFDLDIDGDGEYFMSVSRFIPDFKILNGTCNITIDLRNFPSVTAASSPLGPFNVSSATTQVNTRARSRSAALKIETTNIDQNWRFGLFRFDSRPDGRR